MSNIDKNLVEVRSQLLATMSTQYPAMTDDQKETLEKSIDDTLSRFVVPDTKVYRAAVYSLAGAVIISILGVFFLAAKSVDVPDIISFIAGAAIGAIAGMVKS